MLKVDNRIVGQTGWGPVAQQSWDQTFVIPLERVRPALVRPGVTLGHRVEGQPHLQPGLSDTGPRAGDRGALAGLATAVRRGLPAAGGLPGQCLSPAHAQPGAPGAALCPGAPCPLITWVPGPLGGVDIEAQREEVSEKRFPGCLRGPRGVPRPVSLSGLPCFMGTLDKCLSSLGLSFPTATNEDVDSVSRSPSGSCIVATGGSGRDPGGWGGAHGRWGGRGLGFR